MKKTFNLAIFIFTTTLLSGCVGIGLFDCTDVEDPNTGTKRQLCIPSKSTLTQMNPESQENIERLKQQYEHR